MHKMWIFYVNYIVMNNIDLLFYILGNIFYYIQNIEIIFFKRNCIKIVLYEKSKKALILLDLSFFFTYNRNDCF